MKDFDHVLLFDWLRELRSVNACIELIKSDIE